MERYNNARYMNMTKYICDFDEVSSIASKINELANQVTEDTEEYLTTMDTILFNWSGQTKENFTNRNINQTNKIKVNAKMLIQASEYLKQVVLRIQSAEEELSSLNI